MLLLKTCHPLRRYRNLSFQRMWYLLQVQSPPRVCLKPLSTGCPCLILGQRSLSASTSGVRCDRNMLFVRRI
jgi:hypothetical protein